MAARFASACDGAVVEAAVVTARDCCRVDASSLDDVFFDVLDRDRPLLIGLAFESCLAQDAAGAMVPKLYEIEDWRTNSTIDQSTKTRGPLPCQR